MFERLNGEDAFYAISQRTIRQPKCKGRAFTASAFYPDLAAQRARHTTADRETQSDTGPHVRFDTREFFEQQMQLVFRNTDPSVFDIHHNEITGFVLPFRTAQHHAAA